MMKSSFQNYDSLLQIFEEQVVQRGDATSFIFLGDGESISETQSYIELHEEVLRIAGALKDRVAVAERVLLLYPAGLRFLPAFLACMYVGALPVISSFSRQRKANERLKGIAEDCDPSLILTESSQETVLEEMLSEGMFGELKYLSTDVLGLENEKPVLMNLIQENTAFLQYTSGSTAEPRGVVVTHRNLLHNLEMHRRVMQIELLNAPDEVFVSWLPHFHQMGLVSIFLMSLGVGGKCCFMPSLSFVKKPVRWLQAVSQYGGTVIGGPNFAYDLCSSKISEQDKLKLKLNSLKAAFVSSEPIHSSTLFAFADAFSSCGFEKNTLLPAYGQAENTTLITGDYGASILWVNKRALGNRQIVPLESADARESIGLVSSGYSWLEQTIVVVNTDTHSALPDDEIGEVWLKGDSVVEGYWRNPELTQSVFHGQLNPSGSNGIHQNYLKTGDLGFLHEGHLFITGRSKELIIVRGRNLYPQDLERTIAATHPLLNQGRGAAFSTISDNQEVIVCVHEVMGVGLETKQFHAMAKAVQQHIIEVHNTCLEEVVFVRKNAVPRTTSGKIARVKCRDNWMKNQIRGELFRLSFKKASISSRALDSPIISEVDFESVENWLIQLVDIETGISFVDPEENLHSLGFDSLGIVNFLAKVEQAFQCRLAEERFFFDPTLRRLAQLLTKSKEREFPIAKEQKDTAQGPSIPSLKRKFDRKVINDGPLWAGRSIGYQYGVRFLRELTKHSSYFSRKLPNEMELIKHIYSEVLPDCTLEDFTQQNLFANLWIPWRSRALSKPRVFERWVKCVGQECLENDLLSHSGVILACTHTAMMNDVGKLPFLEGRKVGYLGHLRPKHLKQVGEHVLAEQLVLAGDSAATRIALRSTLIYKAKRILKEGGVVILFPDDTEGRGGVQLPFFNRLRPFRPGIADLALECEAAIIPLSTHILLNGEVRFELGNTILPQGKSPDGILKAYAAALEFDWKHNLSSMNWFAFKKHRAYPLGML